MEIRRAAVFVSAIILISINAPAGNWPEIPKNEWELSSLAAFPNAAAVVLDREGLVHFDKNSRSSYLDVYARIKILTPEGLDYASIQLSSSDYMRVKDLEGRTHLPGGRVVDLPAEARFTKEYSDYFGLSIVSCAMPEVVAGAIIEYRYRTYFDSIFYPRAWYFQTDIPVLRSQVSFELPHNLSVVPLVYKTLKNIDLKEDSHENVAGGRLIYTARNLPPVPDEPSRFPFHDLASRVLMLPVGQRDANGMHVSLFDEWKHSIELVWGFGKWGYGHFLSDNGKAKKIAKSLRRGANPVENAREIYRWVRDEIQTVPASGIWVGQETADDLIHNKKGELTGKALLLHAMLKAAKIKSDVVWISPKTRNQVNKNIPNPTQFRQAIVQAKIKGGQYFLDPTDPRLAFGKLRPSMQGVPALVVRKKKYEWVTTPQTPAEESFKKAEIQLAVASDGRASGKGKLSLGGNHAWRRLDWKGTAEETKTAWLDWLKNAYPNFDIEEVQVSESIEEQRVGVEWTMRQREDAEVGGECSLYPADPFRLSSNPYTLAPTRRLTPLQLLFPDVELVDLKVSWQENWFVDIKPELKNFSNDAGQLGSSFEENPENRTAHMRREWKIGKTVYVGATQYGTLRDLFAAALNNDAEELILATE